MVLLKKIILFISLIIAILIVMLTLDFTNLDGIAKMWEKLCE